MTIRRAPIRKRRVAGLLVVVALAAVVCDQLLASALSTTPSLVRVPHGGERRPPSAHRALPGELRGAPGRPGPAVAGGTTAGSLGEADGAVPDGTTVFDDGVPGVAKLDPALVDALRRAATDAADEGVELLVDSGWRSPRYQQQLLDDAVSKYGSEERAARWVARPDRSAHVSGDAVDLGPSGATAWLSRHGAEYGLCQIYGNEPWHYERRPRARSEGCPPMYADPSQDPRLQP
jgi:hypothetical protein